MYLLIQYWMKWRQPPSTSFMSQEITISKGNTRNDINDLCSTQENDTEIQGTKVCVYVIFTIIT